jgi:hypothetical protein
MIHFLGIFAQPQKPIIFLCIVSARKTIIIVFTTLFRIDSNEALDSLMI